MSKEGGGGGGERRRSARISALEEEACKSKSKTKKKPHQQQQDGTTTSTAPAPPPAMLHDSGSGQPLPDRKRGRKKKRLEDVVVTSVAKDEVNPKHEDTPINTDQQAYLPSLQRFPEKCLLEFILDILQRRDTHEIFAVPVDPEEVEGYCEIVKEPMDFGTMRAKLQEGMYTTLEQFEHDVFLISSNAMLFNSSTTIYFRQARAIHELAKRVFHALKTDPKNFELEFSLARKRPGRKPQGEAGGSRTKLATTFKPGGMKTGVSPSGRPCSLNGPSLRRNTQACLLSSSSNFHIDRRDSEILSGSRDGKSLNLFETERHLTYRPWTSFLSENDSIVSSVYNCSKALMHVNHGGFGYKESLMRFVKGLGPTAQMVANRKLGLIEAPNCQSLTLDPSIKASNCLIPAPPGPRGPAHLDGFINGQMPHCLLPNLPGNSNVITDANDQLNVHPDAFRGGKVQSDNHRMDIQCAFQGDMVPADDIMGIHSALQGERVPASNRKDIYSALHGEMATSTCGMMDIFGPSRGEIVHARDKTGLIRGVVREDITHQNQNTQIQLGSYLPITGIESLNDCSESSLLPLEITKVPSLVSHYLEGEGRSNAPPGPNNGANLAQVGQPLEWSRPTPWGPQAIYDFPYMQMRFSKENPLEQDTYVRQELQIATAPQGGPPFEDAVASFYERGPPQSHRAESSAQCFWNTQQQSLLDIQSPDLALQL